MSTPLSMDTSGYTFRHRSVCRTSADSGQECLTSGKEYTDPGKTQEGVHRVRLPRWRQCRSCERRRFSPWVGKIPWRKKWQPAPVFLPGKFHGRGSLPGYSPCGYKESDTTEAT